MFAKKWAKTLPPARPSLGDLRAYNQLLKPVSQKIKTALVLGATPELRDLLAKYKFKVSLVDNNINMIKALSLLRKRKTKEQIFLADWRKKFTNQKFDLIVSDTGINMLSWVDWPRTFKNIQNMLTKDGVSLQKIAFQNPQQKNMASHDIIKRWQGKKLKTPDLRWLLEMYSDYKTYNPKTMLDDKAILIKEFEKSYKKGDLTEKDWEYLQIYDDKVVMTIPSRPKVDSLAKKYFKILKTAPGKDFLYCRDMPVYFLKPKQ